jgi:hypothetical protein
MHMRDEKEKRRAKQKETKEGNLTVLCYYIFFFIPWGYMTCKANFVFYDVNKYKEQK